MTANYLPLAWHVHYHWINFLDYQVKHSLLELLYDLWGGVETYPYL